MDPPTTTTVIADDPLPQVPGTTPKLRLMCSYGGHIFPTPHEKSLRYLGGETRMVVVDRRSSLASIVSRLSSSLLNGRRNFSLKYQLPNEELDSLVSLSSDEDLENLIEEYDRIVATASSSSPAFRLRVFIFFSKPETAASMGSLLDDAKSETWFVDALNGVSLLPRGLSDSAAVVDQLLDLDSVSVEINNEQQTNAIDAHEVFTGMSDSYLVENNSSPSFGSSSSSPSMSNLPPIRVRAEESVRAGIDDTVVSKSCAAAAAATAPYSDAVVYTVGFERRVGEADQFQAVSDDERSDRSKAQVGFRKPPLPMYLPTQHAQQQNKNGLQYNLPSPDSVASETSIASASSDSKLVLCQDPVQTAVKENRAPTSPLDRQKQVPATSPSYQMMQLHETTHQMPPQTENDGYSQQQQQMQQQQRRRLEVQQQRYFNSSLQSESETRGDQMPLSAQTNQYPNSDLQNQRMHHLQERVYISSPSSAEQQENLLQHQQQHFIHPCMLLSYETTAVQGQIPLFQHQQQHQLVPASAQHINHPPPNQAEHQSQEQQAPQPQQVIQDSAQYAHQASIGQAQMPSYYMYTTQPPHQQLHHQTMYMLPVAQPPPYHALPQSSNIPDTSLTRYPTQLSTTMLPAPAIQTQTQNQMETTTSSSVLMSQNPNLIQHPSSQQYASYSQFLHPAQTMAVSVTHERGYASRDPHIYYTDQPHSNFVPQYQTMNSFNHAHGVLPSQAASHLPPVDQHP